MLTKKNFVHIMKKYALEKMAENKTWFLIDFCQLGFIGKHLIFLTILKAIYLSREGSESIFSRPSFSELSLIFDVPFFNVNYVHKL